MEPRPALERLACLNSECKDFGQAGRSNLRVRKIYGQDRIRYLRCRSCGQEFSERKGTALFNCKIGEAKAVAVIEHLDEGSRVSSTAYLVKVHKNTVRRLVRQTGWVSRHLHDRLVRGLRPKALQFDEKWSYTGKKRRHCRAEEQETMGDHWDVNGIDPVTKLLVTVLPGARTAQTIRAAVADAAGRLAPKAPLPAIFTDGEESYQAAILHSFSHWYTPARLTHLGRPPTPKVQVPHNLVYAQIVKHRSGQRVTKVEIRPVFGKNKLAQIVTDLGWKQANTSAVERFNLTDRLRNSRKVRKTAAFSKNRHDHDAQTWLSVLRYNFHHCHRSLRLKSPTGRYQHRTPAMAAGLIAAPCSTLHLLRLCPDGLG